VDDVHTPEILNTISASGLPNHKLRLKVGVSVMLLRNFDKKNYDYAMEQDLLLQE
jgi:ATP-dependent DNA helicase PIF1